MLTNVRGIELLMIHYQQMLFFASRWRPGLELNPDLLCESHAPYPLGHRRNMYRKQLNFVVDTMYNWKTLMQRIQKHHD